MHDVAPPRPAGFWIRAVALGLDAIVFALVQASFAALASRLLGPAPGEGSPHPSVLLHTLLFTAAYTTVLHVVAGQTLGKSLVGIRVVGADGALLTPGPALLRYLAYWVSLASFGLGFLMAGLRRDKRALHDLLAGSRVERLPARPRPARRPGVTPAPAGTLQDPAVRHAGDPGPGA
jgi:uncharacterized RDD family membrane protein YckC